MANKVYRADELADGGAGWVGLPTKPGERLQGLSRSAVYQGIDSGKIKTACIRQPGKLTGKRLVWLPSVMAYIESFTEQPGGEQ
jgi:hypothetical protein